MPSDGENSAAFARRNRRMSECGTADRLIARTHEPQGHARTRNIARKTDARFCDLTRPPAAAVVARKQLPHSFFAKKVCNVRKQFKTSQDSTNDRILQ